METVDSVFDKMIKEHEKKLKNILKREEKEREKSLKKSEQESKILQEGYKEHKKRYSQEEWDNFNKLLQQDLSSLPEEYKKSYPKADGEVEKELKENEEKIKKFRKDYLINYIKLFNIDLNNKEDVKELKYIHLSEDIDDAAYSLATCIFDAVEYVEDDYTQDWASLNKEPFIIKLKKCFPKEIWEEAIQYYKDGNHDT